MKYPRSSRSSLPRLAPRIYPGKFTGECRCGQCDRLLFRATGLAGTVEIACRHCRVVNEIQGTPWVDTGSTNPVLVWRTGTHASSP